MSNDPNTGLPTNNLRIDMYRYLLPEIIKQDQQAGFIGFNSHWDDDTTWDSGDPLDVWDSVGLQPVIQTLFFALESMEGENIGVIETLPSLMDPFRCPERYLPLIAESFGYSLDEDLPIAARRIVVQGLVDAFKTLGTFTGFQVFFRMIAMNIEVFPIWKKAIFEEFNRYSRVKEITESRSEPVGPAPNQTFNTVLSGAPIKPGTIRITDGTSVLRDDPPVLPPDGVTSDETGTFIGPTGLETGTINYRTGALTLDFGAATTSDVTATYEAITDEFPFLAARIDIEVLINPGGGPFPPLDPDVIAGLLRRIDEVRPIHIVARAFAIAVELRDDITPAATDAQRCTEILRDIRDGFGGSPGEHRNFMLDQGLNAEDDALCVERIVASVTTELTKLFEDTGVQVCNNDVLIINTGGADEFF